MLKFEYSQGTVVFETDDLSGALIGEEEVTLVFKSREDIHVLRSEAEACGLLEWIEAATEDVRAITKRQRETYRLSQENAEENLALGLHPDTPPAMREIFKIKNGIGVNHDDTPKPPEWVHEVLNGDGN